MGIWDTYENRVYVQGKTKREAALFRASRRLSEKLGDSLSYHGVLIDGEERSVIIDDSDNLNEKIMHSLPGEDFMCGSLVEWADNHWLITEKDANNELRTRVKLLQCNFLLKWIDEDHIIHEQWCVIEDGTKYLTGEYEDKDFFVTRGDSRIAMTIARNSDTVKFSRNCRFLIDDPESLKMNAYLLTKPLKVGKTYNGHGVYSFVLQEVVSTDNDNFELGIANYYLHFPKKENSDTGNKDDKDNNTSSGTGKKGWL